jgi:hypothetical protein
MPDFSYLAIFFAVIASASIGSGNPAEWINSFIEIGPDFAHSRGMRWFLLILLVLAGSFAGCEKKSATPPIVAAPANPSRPALPTKAQPQLKTTRLWLGAEELVTELALTDDQIRTGMMFRTNMAENAGMLFVFGRPMQAGFWMKNCPLPLSCAYINPEGSIVEIHDMKPQDTNSIVAASADVQYVLEVNQGWFVRHHIDPGTLVRSEFGSLPETFFSRRR